MWSDVNVVISVMVYAKCVYGVVWNVAEVEYRVMRNGLTAPYGGAMRNDG